MKRPAPVRPPAARGFVLVSSLLLLLVVTIMAVSMFRSFGIEERIAGNLREKHRALQAAESAQQYAEWWLTNGNNVQTLVVCATPVLVAANVTVGQVCSNKLTTMVANVATVPWVFGGGEVGVDYAPPAMNINLVSAAGTYYKSPRFYISLLGASATGTGNVYQIHAIGYGGTANTVAVVESTYLVGTSVKDLGAP